MLQEESNEPGIAFTEHTPRVRRSPFIHTPVLLPQLVQQFNGTITNDKFCLSRVRPLPFVSARPWGTEKVGFCCKK